MASFMRTVQTNTLVQAVLFIVLGLVLLLMPGITLVTIVYMIGAIFAVSAVVSFVAYFRSGSASYRSSGALTTGIFLAIVALVMFIFPTAVAGFFSVLLGAVLILCGVANTVRSLGMRVFSSSMWVVGTIVGILIAIGGVIVIWNPFDTTVVFVMVLGALLVLTGASDLIIEVCARKQDKKREV